MLSSLNSRSTIPSVSTDCGSEDNSALLRLLAENRCPIRARCMAVGLAALIRGSGGTKSMPKPYSDDLCERVIEAVVAGASRREAAESFSLSASSAVRWLQRWRDSGSTRAKLSGGSTSPLEEQVEWLLALVAEQPDLTLDEIVAAMRKQRIPGSRTAVWNSLLAHR